jgi:hypothetical protein
VYKEPVVYLSIVRENRECNLCTLYRHLIALKSLIGCSMVFKLILY